MVAETCSRRRSSGSESSHSAMCSARSRSRPAHVDFAQQRRRLAHRHRAGAEVSITRPKRASSCGARGEPRGVGLVELDDLRNQQDLARDAGFFERRLHALIDDALVRRVLVDDDQAVARLRHDVSLVHLRARGAERALDQFRRRLEAHDARIGGRLAHVEGGLRGLRLSQARRRRATAQSRPAAPASAANRSHRAAAWRPGGKRRWWRRRRSRRRGRPRAPALPSARARSARAPARRRGSALRSWPDAR